MSEKAPYSEARFKSVMLDRTTYRKLIFGPAKPPRSLIIHPAHWQMIEETGGTRFTDSDGAEWRFKRTGLKLETVCPSLGINATATVF